MTTIGHFNTKNPTIKRILKEASELSSDPSPDLHASPLESNLFEWHFTVRGPPAPSPFNSGIYHGRITLPAEYPLRPPSFRFLTPSGRFEVGHQICLSISGFHEETWQPAWGIRTALVALRSFMDTKAGGQVGGVEAADGARKELAEKSRGWTCAVCGVKNEEILKEGEGEDSRVEEVQVPEELRMVTKEELEKEKQIAETQSQTQVQAQTSIPRTTVDETGRRRERVLDDTAVQSRSRALPGTRSTATPSPTRTTDVGNDAAWVQDQPQLQQRRRVHDPSRDDWLDKAIYMVGFFLAIIVARKMLMVI